MRSILIRGRKLRLPAFFPDATYGEIKGLNSKELEKIGVQGVVVNTYHLFKHNKIKAIEKLGIHKYMGVNIPIISDSGGFQIFSLIHRHPELGNIDEDKAVFKTEDGRAIELTPEKAIQIQIKLGADIIMCLDDCRHVEDKQEESVERTIRWARKCKDEFLRLTKNMKDKPLLVGIVQGGESKNLRKYCAQELVNIGFDGYAYGGWPMKNNKLLSPILEYTAKLLPSDKIKYAMGVGKPEDIKKCVKMGYNLFDCVIPTRDARHKRVFFGSKEINIRKKYFKSKIKIEGKTIKQLYEMFKDNRDKAVALATKHNLREYARLMKSFK